MRNSPKPKSTASIPGDRALALKRDKQGTHGLQEPRRLDSWGPGGCRHQGREGR